MPPSAKLLIRSTRRTGRLIPKRAAGLRAGAVILAPGATMPWHSTRHLEELLIPLDGEIELQLRRGRRISRRALAPGRSALLPPQTIHQVSNRRRAPARYIYVTAAAPDRAG